MVQSILNECFKHLNLFMLAGSYSVHFTSINFLSSPYMLSKDLKKIERCNEYLMQVLHIGLGRQGFIQWFF